VHCTYRINRLLAGHNHKMLWFSIIQHSTELIWATVKNWVHEKNVTVKLTLLNLLMKNLIASQKKTGNTDVIMCGLLRISTWIIMFFWTKGTKVLYT
jgi:hypothetical protein